jgi:hypothetical protein
MRGILSLFWRWEVDEGMICLHRPVWKQRAANGQRVYWLTLETHRAKLPVVYPSRKRPPLDEHHELAYYPILLHVTMCLDNMLKREDLIEAALDGAYCGSPAPQVAQDDQGQWLS